MITSTRQFKNALSKVYPSTGQLKDNDPLQHKDSFIFTGDNVIGYNGQFAIVSPLETDFACTVNAVAAKSLFNNLLAEEVKIVQESNKLNITCGNIEAELPIDDSFDSDQFVQEQLRLLHIDDAAWQPLPIDLIAAIEICLFSALRKDNQPYLNAIYLNKDKVISADRARMSIYTLHSPLKAASLIPLNTAKQLIKFSKQFNYYKQWPNSILFASADGKFFVARTISNKYPDVTPAVQMGKVLTRVKFPQSIIGDLKAVSSFADGADPNTVLEKTDKTPRLVNIRINKSDVAITSQSHYGIIKSASKHNSKVRRSIAFATNPDFLLEVLNITNELKMTTQSNVLKGFFKTDNFLHVLAVIDISDNDVPF